MNDTPPSQEETYLNEAKKHIIPMCKSDAPSDHAVGYANKIYNFHHMHNQSQIRSRGYGIGNPIVGLPPGAKDAYYTQPGSPYNDASIRKTVMIGDLDEGKEGKSRLYKSEKWADRLRTPEEKEAIAKQIEAEHARILSATKNEDQKARRKKLLSSRGMGTILGD